MLDDRTIRLAEFVLAWLDLREHLRWSVPAGLSNVHTAADKAQHRLNALIATYESDDPISKTLLANARR